MHDPLQRLYRTKLALLATLLTFTGLGLLLLAKWIEHSAGWHWLTAWPISDIGSGLFTTGLLGVALQYFDGQDSEVRATERLERVIARSVPAMRDAVIDGFAFEPDDLARVATAETLDKIVTNGLSIRLGDASFAEEIYTDVRKQAIGTPERLHDARISIRLSPLPMGRGTPNGRAPQFVATVRWEYSLVPTYPTRRFVCLSSLAEYRELSQDSAANSAWYVGARTGMDASSKDTFELMTFAVDGEERTIRRSAKTGSQAYSVSIGKDAIDAGKPVTVAYAYRTLVSVDEHLLQLRVDQPTRGLSIELDYSDTDIDHINVLDFIASSERTRISRLPPAMPGKIVLIEFDGWVFPRSGVAFVWVLA
ncbi:MAG TPA: hypothetical protein VNU19_03785 [Candidatus Acidoferrum sp.]|jgi:hypothetical protein|nr:hypothetical protein [Candidatus Acidoferrum sp.]